jgi:hypothetical protein
MIKANDQVALNMLLLKQGFRGGLEAIFSIATQSKSANISE